MDPRPHASSTPAKRRLFPFFSFWRYPFFLILQFWRGLWAVFLWTCQSLRSIVPAWLRPKGVAAPLIDVERGLDNGAGCLRQIPADAVVDASVSVDVREPSSCNGPGNAPTSKPGVPSETHDDSIEFLTPTRAASTNVTTTASSTMPGSPRSSSPMALSPMDLSPMALSPMALSPMTSPPIANPEGAPRQSTSLEDLCCEDSDGDEDVEGARATRREMILTASTPDEVPEIEGRIHSVESMTAVDGPGLRYLVFTQGCPRKCVFCQNRDTWDIKEGKLRSSKDLIQQIKKCKPYLAPNNGGVTLSGGEPLMQPELTAALFKEAKLMGITTCLDTTGFGHQKDWNLVLPNTDYVLLCLKSFDPEMYKKLTSNTHRPAFAFTEELKRRDIKFWLRYVMLPGWTDNEFEYQKLIEFSHDHPSCQGIELLPYHRLGAQKWATMGFAYPLEGLEPPSKDAVREVKQKLLDAGVKVLCSV